MSRAQRKRNRRRLAWDHLEARSCPAPFGPFAYMPGSMIPSQRTDAASLALEAFYAQQAASWSPQVAFFGDSLTYNFAYGAGSQVWAPSISPFDAADFGEQGDTTQNILWRIENGEFPSNPKVVVLQVGANNLGTDGESPQDTLAGIENLVSVIHRLSPTSKILVVGMVPVGDPSNAYRPEIVQINAQLARFVDDQSSFFLDISQALLAADGTLTSVDDADLVHLNATGYQAWAQEVIAPLDQLLGLVPSASNLLPLSTDFSPFDVSNPDLPSAEVTGLYETILGRAPDAAGLLVDVNYLDAGGSLSALATDLLDSSAYETNLVASFYRQIAGREGSSAEVQAWVNLMQQGVDAERIAALMMTSGGFDVLHPDNASFLEAVFTDAIGVAPTPSELAAWENYMAGGVSRGQVVYELIHSAKATQDAVLGLASVFWAQPIDPSTEAGDVQFLIQGGSLSELAAAFASSPTFVARAAQSVA